METPNTFKFRTVIYIVLAFVIPFWIITLPLFLILAWSSYKAGYKDMQLKKDCVFCKSRIPEDATVCAYCRRDVDVVESVQVNKNTTPCRYCKVEIADFDESCYSCGKAQKEPLELSSDDFFHS